MDFEFLIPLDDQLVEDLNASAIANLSHTIQLHTAERGIPDLEGIAIAIIGVRENRLGDSDEFLSFRSIRQAFYSLFPGNWHLSVADLGDIERGLSVEDTYYAVQSLVGQLLEKSIIPLILGGSQDLIYAQYRAYDRLEQMVNLVNIDNRFDLGDAEKPINHRSYVGKIVVNKPYNLFNYSNLGYQTYYNSQDEIELMERLFFDAYRLGEVSGKLSIVEPVMRDANLVGLDLGSINTAAIGGSGISPNGFDGKEICALARYAGISDKISSFGIYEYTSEYPKAGNMLIAQIMWYFIEGVNYRTNENTITAKEEFFKYQVPIDDQVLVFFKSPISGRWWIEIPFISNSNTKLKRHTLLPCSHEDYLEACNQVIPERWYKTKRKNEI